MKTNNGTATSKATNKKAKGTKPSSAKASAKAKTKAEATAKATEGRELKYIYPKDIMGDKQQLERKAFRQKVRAAIRQLEKHLSNASTNKDKAAAKKELNAYLKQVHQNPELV